MDDYEDIGSIPYGKVLAWMHKKIEGSIAEYSRILAEIAESREKLDRYTDLLDNERKNERTLTESAAEKNAVIGEQKSHADALSKKLTFPTAAALRQEIAKLTEAAADMNAREERARKLLITTEKELEAAKRALETVAYQLQDSIADEYEACEALCRELDEKTRLLTQEKLRLMTDAEKNRSAMALLLAAMEKLKVAKNAQAVKLMELISILEKIDIYSTYNVGVGHTVGLLMAELV